MQFPDGIESDPEVIARRMNEFFIESVKQINEAIEDVEYESHVQSAAGPWDLFREVTRENVYEILRGFKTKSGIDNVNVDVLKDSFQLIGGALTSMINESLQGGKCPDNLRETLVVPIRKIANTIKPEEMRPINMTTLPDKLLQSCVKQQFEEFVEQNDIMTKFQSGFRANHSCETAVNLVVADFKHEFQCGNTILVVFLDLQRAFETIDRETMIKKLSEYGIGGRVLSWFDSWLTGRTQRTKFDDKISDATVIDIGLPQGAPLSCSLFNMYNNDLPNVLKHCKIKLFADDTMVWVTGSDVEELFAKMNEDLAAIGKYFKMSKLKANVSKTKYMIIGRNNEAECELQLNGTVLQRVDKMKYLGVILDQKLDFKENAEFVLKKVAKKSYFIGRMRKKLDKGTKLLLYKTLLQPHIDYCSSILFLSSDDVMKRLQVLCNRALRAVLLRDNRSSVEELLRDAEVLDVKQRVYFNTLILMHKARLGLLPSYLSEHLSTVSDNQPYNLRRNGLLRLPQYRTTNSQNSFLYKGVQEYNAMMSTTEISSDLRVAKEQVAQYVKSVTRFAIHRVRE